MKIRGSKGLSNKTFTQADAHHLWSGEHKEGWKKSVPKMFADSFSF